MLDFRYLNDDNVEPVSVAGVIRKWFRCGYWETYRL
jgi:hypothetical protein